VVLGDAYTLSISYTSLYFGLDVEDLMEIIGSKSPLYTAECSSSRMRLTVGDSTIYSETPAFRSCDNLFPVWIDTNPM
jgi:hypothetical protein